MKRFFFTAWLFLSLSPLALAARGELMSYEPIETFSKKALQTKADPDLPPRYGATLYRITYESQNPLGVTNLQSGILWIPTAPGPLPVLSLQHGTLIKKDLAPSIAFEDGATEAGQGFVTLVSDYVGFGASVQETLGYLIPSAYGASGRDLILASEHLLKDLEVKTEPGIFLKGYSEGGFATLALQKNLEAQPIPGREVRASAPAAGPYNLLLAAASLLLSETTKPTYLGQVMVSYQHYFVNELDLSTYVNEPYADLLPTLLKGELTGDEVEARLPVATHELIQSDYLRGFLQRIQTAGEGKVPDWDPLEAQLVSQSLTSGFVPQSLTRLYHCQDDEVVSVSATLDAYETWAPMSPELSLEVIKSNPTGKGYDHDHCPVDERTLAYFHSLR